MQTCFFLYTYTNSDRNTNKDTNINTDKKIDRDTITGERRSPEYPALGFEEKLFSFKSVFCGDANLLFSQKYQPFLEQLNISNAKLIKLQ